MSINSNLNNINVTGNQDLRNLNKNLNCSNLNNRIVYHTVLEQDQKNLVAEINNDTQSETTAKLSDPKLSGAFLNSVNTSFKSQTEGRVTAVVAKARHTLATENQL